MSACEFLGSNVDFYVPLVLKRADLFLAADLFLECLDLRRTIRCVCVCVGASPRFGDVPLYCSTFGSLIYFTFTVKSAEQQ